MRFLNKNFLSAIVILVFAAFAVASKVNKIHYGAFNYSNKVEGPAEASDFLVKNDGTKVYGKTIHWKSGILTKDQVTIDDQKFKVTEIRGYRKGETYYGRQGNQYIQRIVHGKINVYVKFTDVTTTDNNGHMRSYTRTDQYAQVGENGEMQILAGQKEIKEMVSDCQKAYDLADISNKQMRKEIKADRNYLNSIFETYNNCK